MARRKDICSTGFNKAHCECPECTRRRNDAFNRKVSGGSRRSNWSPAAGGSDADGNPVTVSFGSGKAAGEIFIADGDQSEGDFFSSANHDHYGSGEGPNDNGTRRGRYTGRGS